jgi:transmembrane sensor
MNLDNNKKIDDLIVEFLRGTINSQGKEDLRNWLASDKSNKAYFRQMYLLWKASAIQYFKVKEIEKAYQKLQLNSEKRKMEILPDNKERSLKSLTLTFRKLAAIIVFSLISGVVLHSLFQKKQYVASFDNAQNVINVPLGSKSNITLPDGSEVCLNAGSKLSYTFDYGKKLREVNLVGEGYFKVAKQASKPFIVHTSGANIKALGTEFNVKAYNDENVIETILVEGSVVVSKTALNESINSSSKESIVLKQGQKAQIFKIPNIAENNVKSNNNRDRADTGITGRTMNGNGINLKHSNTEVETSWKEKRWIIQKESLTNLFILFERRYNVTIVSRNNELSKYQFSGTIQNETLEQVLSIVSLTVPISYSIDKGKVEITLNQKLENKYKRAYTN